MQQKGRLVAVKLVHTIVWIFFVACILGVGVAGATAHFRLALGFIGVVLAEVLVLALNRWTCPLTRVAAQYTADRSPNFDIYLPRWLAEHNKVVFGTIFVVAIVFTTLRWAFFA